MQTHSSVGYLLTYGFVQNVLCFLFCYIKILFVIFLNLMICGRLLDLPCKQIMSKHYRFKKLEITCLQSH